MIDRAVRLFDAAGAWPISLWNTKRAAQELEGGIAHGF